MGGAVGTVVAVDGVAWRRVSLGACGWVLSGWVGGGEGGRYLSRLCRCRRLFCPL